MSNFAHSLILRLLACLLSAPLLAAETVKIAAFEYPPLYQDAPDKGVSGDIVIAAFKMVDINARLNFYSVNRMIHSVAQGDQACGIGGSILFEAPEIASAVNIVALIQYVPQGFLFDSRRFPNGLKHERIEDMQHYRVSVLAGSGIMRLLERHKLPLIASNTHESAARRLQMGSVDAWAIVDLSGAQTMQKLFPAEASHFKSSAPFHLGDVSLICSKARDPEQRISQKFNEGLAIIKKNGEYMRLMAKYYGGVNQINKSALADDMR